MAVLATITALGGGVIGDVLIGSTPPDALLHTWWLVVPLAATVVTFFLHPQLTLLRQSIAFAVSAMPDWRLSLHPPIGQRRSDRHGEQ